MAKLIITCVALGLIFLPTGCGRSAPAPVTGKTKRKGVTGRNPYDYDKPTVKPKVAPEETNANKRIMVTTRDTFLLKRLSAQKLYFEDRSEEREEFWQSRIAKGYAVPLSAGTQVIHHTDKNSSTVRGHLLLRCTVYKGESKGERGRVPAEDLKPLK